MMKKILICLMLCIATVMMAQAQKTEYETAIRKMIEVSRSMDAFKQMLPQMLSMFKQQAPSVPEEVWSEVEKELDNLFIQIVDRMVPIYQKYLTLEDVNQIIAFYESPVGKKLADTLPQLTQESMQIGQEIGGEFGKKVQAILQEKGYGK